WPSPVSRCAACDPYVAARPRGRGMARRSSSCPAPAFLASSSCGGCRSESHARNTDDVRPRVVRYSERPELWDSISDLSDEVWPEYNTHGQALNYYWNQLYDVFPDWQFVLYDPDEAVVLAEGHTIPLAWDGTHAGLGPGIDATV